MKLITLTHLLIVSLCAGFCCPEENDDYQNITILNNNIIKVENNKDVFNIGDKISISINIQNEQVSEDGKTIILSEYINQSSSIFNYFILYKETNFNTLSIIPINNESLNVTLGNASIYQEYIQIESIFINNEFVNEFEITLLEPGTFYLSGHQIYDDSKGYSYFNFGNNNTNISIVSQIINSDERGLYKFVVN